MRRAFTLIELLVVIAIIAILAAILFPVFAQAKVAAKAAVILSGQKQQNLAEQMYIGDFDDTMPSYITRTNVPASVPLRPDCVSWVVQFQPYIKNGNPVYPPNTSSATEVPPVGIFNDSMWNEKNWIAAADQPDCDGAGALDSWAPVTWFHAHFGMTFPVNNIGWHSEVWGAADSSAGTQAKPIYAFAGSYLVGRPLTNTTWENHTMSQTQVARPAETAIITDGFTGVIHSGGFGVTFGCESANLYKGGGNVCFIDGHVKFVKGNSQRYEAQDSSGLYYQKYYTWDR